MLATKNGHTDVVQALLEAKAEPNLREKVRVQCAWFHGLAHHVYTCTHGLQNSGWSALFFSVQEGHLKIAELLIAAGAVVDRKDKVTVNVCALY